MSTASRSHARARRATRAPTILSADALASSPSCTAASSRAAQELLAARRARAAELAAGGTLDFLDGDARDPRGRLAGPRRRGRTTQDRRVEITGPTDRKLVINALNSRRQGLHGRLRGRQLADLAQPGRRPREPDRRDRGHDHLRQRRTAALRARRRDRDAARAPARLAPAREAPADRRRAGRRRRCSTSACTSSTAPAAARARLGARTSTCRRLEHHLEARLWNDVLHVHRGGARRSRTARSARRC